VNRLPPQCRFCARPIERSQDMAALVSGWTVNRRKHGDLTVRLVGQPTAVAHRACLEAAVAGVPITQERLF